MGYPKAALRVRFVADSGEDGTFEMQCGSCLLYVPLIPEEWQPKNGLTRCRACWREYGRLKQRGYQANEANAELTRTRARLRYAMNKRANLEAKAAWRAANKERIAAYNKAYREKHKEEVIAASRAYYTECRDVILAKKRQAHAEARAA